MRSIFSPSAPKMRRLGRQRLSRLGIACLSCDEHFRHIFSLQREPVLVHPAHRSGADAAAPVELFSAWYRDQTKDRIHSPEICLPGGGWETSFVKAVDIAEALGAGPGFDINRAVITKNRNKFMVFCCFDRSSRHIASDCKAKAMLVWSGITEGRSYGALVRLINAILPGEAEETAEVRLISFLSISRGRLARHVDGRVYGEANLSAAGSAVRRPAM
jgi:EpsI family protein